MPLGTGGLTIAVLVFVAIWLAFYWKLEDGPFNLDPEGIRGAFEPFLAKYLRLSEVIVGLATGSIVLLIGSSALHGQSGRLPWYYASPLVLLGFCVLYGVAFMVWLLYHYEEYRHGAPHTKKAYMLCLTLGFASLVCFLLGYGWLIVGVTR